jgi:small subunit ribosomal protein S16
MPTKIRLQRHGKKRYAYYHVVVADARAPRDGKFIEKLGTYNPNENPARIDISFDRSLHWVKEGAQPTDTVRALLSYKGVMHKDHLDRGVTKGALTQDQADKKFDAWMKEKEAKVDGKKDGLAKAADADAKARLAAETETKNKRAAEVLAKQSELAAALQAEADAKAALANPVIEEAPTEEVTEEAAPAAEATPEVKEEAPVAEAKEEAAPEAKAEEKKED